jgi:hypothetical protein
MEIRIIKLKGKRLANFLLKANRFPSRILDRKSRGSSRSAEVPPIQNVPSHKLKLQSNTTKSVAGEPLHQNARLTIHKTIGSNPILVKAAGTASALAALDAELPRPVGHTDG